MSGEALSDDEVDEALQDLKIWGVEFGKLATRVEFENYDEVTRFANTVFNIADEEGKYPEVEVHEDAVLIDIWTPDVGVTEEDVDLARKIEEKLRSMDWE